MKQPTRGLQDFAFCWTVRISGAKCPLFQLRKGPHAWIPHPLRHLKVRLPGIWFSLEVMSRPRELIPRLEASGQNHRGLSNLVKDNGRIRGIVTGDTFRRGVARTMAQQFFFLPEKDEKERSVSQTRPTMQPATWDHTRKEKPRVASPHPSDTSKRSALAPPTTRQMKWHKRRPTSSSTCVPTSGPQETA